MNKQTLIAVICLAALRVPDRAAGQSTVVDRIVAVVGRECILLSDVTAQIDFYTLNNHVDPSTPGLRDQVLQAMIDKKLMLSKAAEDTTINVREEDVTNQLDALVAQRIQQVGSEKRLEELYGMPISKMKREFRDETRKELMVQMLQQNKFGDVQVSRREVEEFYATYKDSLPKVPEELELYHIFRLPKVSESSRAATMAKAQKIIDSIKAGGDFADFARRYSEDKGTAQFGGDLGFARRGQFLREFEEAVFSLKENQIANIVETPLGLHIMQLLERRGESVHARHILFKVERTDADAESTKAFLRSLKDSVLRGGDFSDLAKRYSEDKESGPQGGLLGSFSTSQFDQSLLDVVKDMKEGDVSNPAEVNYGTSKGYHIIYLKKRIPEHTINITDDWKRLEALAVNAKRNQLYLDWLKQLRSEIYWETRL
ncbi:MAG TPA: peptidylprolyl isomerase [Bacteroidota bacterium]|nr:peptidylprolyl isomerase [Bacteroidota bacterium]